MSSGRSLRRWQCPQCGLSNAPQTRDCMACFKSRFPSNYNGNKSRNNQNNRKAEKRTNTNSDIRVRSVLVNNNNNNNNNYKYCSSRPRPSSLRTWLHQEPQKISDCIYDKAILFLTGYLRSEIDEYLYPESGLIFLLNLYLSDGAIFRCYQQEIQWIMDRGLKLISRINGTTIKGKGIAIIGFKIAARNRSLLYEWQVNVRTFNPPDSFIGIIAGCTPNFTHNNNGNNNNNCYVNDHDNDNNVDFTTFDYAQSQFCNGIGGERHRVYRMGKLDRKIKYKSGWHCNNVSHWNDNMDIVKCRYDGRNRQISFTKFIRNTNKFKSICTIQLPNNLPNHLTSWYPAIYLGHISDSATVYY